VIDATSSFPALQVTAVGTGDAYLDVFVPGAFGGMG